MRKIKNILIRELTDQDRDMIEFVKRETGCNQASKALMQAGYAFCQRQKTGRRNRFLQEKCERSG